MGGYVIAIFVPPTLLAITDEVTESRRLLLGCIWSLLGEKRTFPSWDNGVIDPMATWQADLSGLLLGKARFKPPDASRTVLLGL